MVLSCSFLLFAPSCLEFTFILASSHNHSSKQKNPPTAEVGKKAVSSHMLFLSKEVNCSQTLQTFVCIPYNLCMSLIVLRKDIKQVLTLCPYTPLASCLIYDLFDKEEQHTHFTWKNQQTMFSFNQFLSFMVKY